MIAPTKRRQIDRVAMRHALEVRRRRLTEELRLRVARIRDEGAEAAYAKNPEDDDPAALDVTMVEIVTQMLQRIEAAIERLDGGQYGRCVRCQGRIADARLRAMPFAVRCRECETIREREAALRRSNLRSRSWELDGGIAVSHESA
jgi:RNA polymerase-binding transcription factor